MTRGCMKKVSLAVFSLMSLTFVPVPALTYPPPLETAHGWRKKNDSNYDGYTGKKWDKDYGIIEGRCNSAAVGAVLGGAVGGVDGSRAANKVDRPVANVVGAVLGAAEGAQFGEMVEAGDMC